jgi:hypothetical protein
VTPPATEVSDQGGIEEEEADADDDDEESSDEDDEPDGSLFDNTTPPRRTTRAHRPRTFYGCHTHHIPVQHEYTTTDPPPDITLTCSLSTIQDDAIDPSDMPDSFSTHEFNPPNEPTIHPSTDPPKPFGMMHDWDPDDISPAVARQLNYLAYLDLMRDGETDELDNDATTWRCVHIPSHKVVVHHSSTMRRRIIFVCAEWMNGGASWVQLQAMLTHDPFVLIQYASDNELTSQTGWKWVLKMVSDTSKMATVVKSHHTAVKNAPKYKFGIEVPRNVRHALQLDEANGNTLWRDAMATELGQINDYKTFRVPDSGEDLSDYQRIPYHFVFDVKFDLRRKAWLVAGGNHTEPPREDIYSGVVGMESLRIGFVVADMNNLSICAADVGNAFLYGKTREKVYIIAGPEFGPLEGQRLVVDRGLYGLRSSAAGFHEHFANKLRNMGFRPSLADSDFWIKDCGDHYEYIATYVDDLLVFSRNPMAIINEIKADYVLKGIGEPEYYLGGNV